MRGKLRDKRAETKRDFKRDAVERKRMSKRDVVVWLSQQLDEENENLLDVEEDGEVEVSIPQPQPAKK